jgi:hypothetical protein
MEATQHKQMDGQRDYRSNWTCYLLEKKKRKEKNKKGRGRKENGSKGEGKGGGSPPPTGFLSLGFLLERKT